MEDDGWINQYILGMTSTNCYLVNGEYIIDPGGMNSELREDLEEFKNNIRSILLTHAHYDHIGGIGDVRDIIGDCPVVCHRQEAEILEDPEKNMSLWSGAEVAFEADRYFDDDSEMTLNDTSLEVIHTPGHTLGSVSFYWEKNQVLFAGDTLFQEGIGRTDLPGGDHQTLLDSIRRKILSLPRGTRILPGHGPETTVGAEAHDNPYLN